MNKGTGAIPGWGEYQGSPMASLSGPHTANVGLMPVLDYIDVQVYGFDPVTEEEGVLLEGMYVEATGVDPNRIDHDLLPTRTGVSAITKENPEGTPTEKNLEQQPQREGPVHRASPHRLDDRLQAPRL